jgi:YD repeat-containing protein
VYSTTVNVFNTRDQMTVVRQYAGTDQSSTYQDTTMSYDGYGRVSSKHVPEQDANTATGYSYNPDDTINSVTDARGAVCTYGYNGRHQVTSAVHTLSGQPTINLTYGYDAAGNRTSMSDGTGSTSYNYDQLSRMTSETHNITGLGSSSIAYQYNLAGELAGITSPDNITINYAHDSTGRVSAVTGSGASVVATYASNFQYRAWGALKHLDYGSGKTLDAGFNNRLAATSFQIPGLMSKTYDYYADGRLRFSSDLIDHRFDRSYSFDQIGRITNALSGAEARGEGATQNRPYWESFGYDAIGHLTARATYQWTSGQMSTSDSYTNNRHDPVGSLWQYDADGRLMQMPGTAYTYDAAGNVDTVWQVSSVVLGADGDGRQVKSVETVTDPNT